MGTYSSLLHLGRPKPSSEEDVTVMDSSAAVQDVPPVAPTPRPLIEQHQTVPVGESPRRPDPSPARRPLQRAAFDIYEDQVTALKRLKNQRQLALDRDVSKSEIVREALDFFFQSEPK